MNTNLHYEFGNVSALREAKLSQISHIEPQGTNNHTGLMIVGLVGMVGLAVTLSMINPIVGFSTAAGMAEPISEAIILFLPL